MNLASERFIFCENVKRLRQKEKLSKREMSKILGIGVKTLTAIESGIIPPRMGCTMLLKIHKSFGIRPEDMFADLIPESGETPKL